jgi:hypothetical protein
MAQSDAYANINIVSICCDSCDGAREIIEKEDELLWVNVTHYYCPPADKEIAKAALGFRQVPFYVVLNEKGQIEQKGSSKQVDLTNIPGMIVPMVVVEQEVSPSRKHIAVSASTNSPINVSMSITREFCMDDDF